jgi:CHAT domain-containing protein/Tfp pilus assembly protein PilF
LALAGSVRAQGSPGVPAAATAPQSAPILLELGKPIDHEIRGGEKLSYKVHAEAGQFVRVVVLHDGIHVSATLLDPSGKQILIADAFNGWVGSESVSTIAEISGDYQLDLLPSSSKAPPGHFQIQLTDLRPPVDADRTRIKAERAYREGCLLSLQGGADSAKGAAAKWQESFTLWQSLDDKYGQGLSLRNAGRVYMNLGENQKALDTNNQALPLERAAGDRAGEGITLGNIGVIYNTLGEKQKALDYYNQALPLERAVGDRATEGATLTGIGIVYALQGDMMKALDYFTQVLPIRHDVGDTTGEAAVLNNIGNIYAGIGNPQKALDYYTRALPLRRASGDRNGEAITLKNIGETDLQMGENRKALEYFGQALPIFRALGNRDVEATALTSIGIAYDNLGDKEKALDFYNQAIPLKRAVGDPAGEARALNSIGIVYEGLDNPQKALDYYNQALPLYHNAGDRPGEADVLNNIGVVYLDLNDRQKALDYYNRALPLRRATEDRAGEADTLEGIGAVYDTLGEKQKALDFYNQALPLAHAAGYRATEATTLNKIGEVYAGLGENQKALDYYTQSLPLSQAVQDPLQEGHTLTDLMEYWKNLQKPALAVLFGKQAIDRFQRIRRNIGALDKETQQGFLKSKRDSYRELADLLISQGRLPEAQQVLDLLKDEEYSEFTERRGNADPGNEDVALTPMEEAENKEYEGITADITSIGSEWTELHARSARSPEEEKRYAELSNKLTAANQHLEAFLNNLYNSFGKGDQANARVETISEQTGGLQTLVGDLGAGTAAVYTLVLDDKCVVMVITPSTRVAREVPIAKIDLRTKVFAFSSALAQRKSEQDIQAKALDLYNILIKPIEKDLQGAQAKTLVWSLDDVLRYVPIAALYDGKQYFVERYRNVVITTASVGNLKDQPEVSRWRGLAMGVSKDYDGLGQLQAVPGELDSVVRSDKTAGSHGPVPGTILLDDSFTETSMETALDQHPSLVHIASHYIFQPGDDKKSYLLLGGKETGGQGFHLTLADLRDDQRMDFKGIELLTLSGCQTASGSNDSDGREIDGLGITAQRKGAKAVMATLWPVEDASVGQLMATFYKLWVTAPGMTKVEALQQAQLSLLHGAANPNGTHSASKYSNPYYWAPFILIGNWK